MTNMIADCFKKRVVCLSKNVKQRVTIASSWVLATTQTPDVSITFSVVQLTPRQVYLMPWIRTHHLRLQRSLIVLGEDFVVRRVVSFVRPLW